MSFFSTLQASNNFFYLSLFPEFMMITFILVLILVAVLTPKESKIYLLGSFLNASIYFYLFLLAYYLILISYDVFPMQLTIFLCYQTLKMNQMLIYIKMLLIFFALGALFSVKRYLMLYQLAGYEYPLLITLATLSMFFSICANNWILLFLSLEFQALCFLVLFAWNRRSEKAINATLKFTVINFVASTLILLAFIEIILYTGNFNIHLANPTALIKLILEEFMDFNNPSQNYQVLSQVFIRSCDLFNSLYAANIKTFYLNVSYFKPQQMWPFWGNLETMWHLLDNPAFLWSSQINQGFSYSSLWQFTGFLIIIGFGMKLGLVPFGFWLQDLYLSVSLPVLTFFSTAPKLTYLTILLSLYVNVFGFVNPEAFLYPFLILGTLTVIVGNIIMFTVRNNLLILLAWSSISNMGLLFFLFGKYPLNSFTLLFIVYYTISTFLFFSLLQNILISDESGVVRHPIYFTDLTVTRQEPALKLIYMVLVISFLNFFGIPPLLNFWMKFTLLQGLVANTTFFMEWVLLISLVLVTIIGGFGYIRVLYVLLTENNYLGLQSLYWPNTKNDVLKIAGLFFMTQFLIFLTYDSVLQFLNVIFF